tara:strand:+ start:91 stop:309 length:219 start_codon:yes stop_codon:yes gene_type:complete
MSDIKKDLKPLFDWIKTLNTTQKIFVFIGTCFAIFFIAGEMGGYNSESASFLSFIACCVVGYYLFAPQESEE